MSHADVYFFLADGFVVVWIFLVLLISIPWLCIWFILRGIVYVLTCGRFGFPKNPDSEGNVISNHFAHLNALVGRPPSRASTVDDLEDYTRDLPLGPIGGDDEDRAKAQADGAVTLFGGTLAKPQGINTA